MDSGMISGIVTVVFIVVFIGIVWWAYSAGNKQGFDDAANLPFEEEEEAGQGTVSPRNTTPAQQGDKK